MSKDINSDELNEAIRGYVEPRPRATISSEDRAAALEAAKEFVSEANRLLAGRDSIVVTDPQGRNIQLNSKKRIDEVVTAFKDANLIAFYYQHQYQGDTTHSQQHLYAFYPSEVSEYVRNSATKTGLIRGLAYTFFLPTPGPSERVFEANAQTITELLDAIKRSTPFNPRLPRL